MKEDVKVAAPPAWKAFLVGLFVLGSVLAPAFGMVFYFSSLARDRGWYVGTGLPLGFAVGLLVSAGLSAVFAWRASRVVE